MQRQSLVPDCNKMTAGLLPIGMLVFLATIFLQVAPIYAQMERKAPSPTYFAVFSSFYAGNYKDALDGFESEGRSSIKTAQSRWIDSICYETMIGECYYQTGMLDKALEHYTNALGIYVTFNDWMTRVQFIPIRSAGPRKEAPWGVSTRQSQLGYYPATMQIAQGNVNNNDVVKQGGVYQQAYLYSIQPQEIVRCTTLAIRRRTEILGPLCKNDPLTERLVSALSRQVTQPNHWSEAWADVQRGLAFIAAGKEAQGIPCLQRSILAGAEFDHPMTSVALLELGRLALAKGEYPTAAKFFEEATISAVDYPDLGIIEEAFRYAALTHIISNKKGFYPPLELAWKWAKTKDYRHLRTSLALSAAENYSVLGQVKDAAAMIEDARSLLGKRKALPGRLGGRLNYLAAQILFQQRKIKEGQTAFYEAMAYMQQQGSTRIFQLNLADKMYTSGAATPRLAMEYYKELLRDPLPGDWLLNPMETLAVLSLPHSLAMEHWFEVALDRREVETAWEIADRARRHRFFSALDFGGRLESLRWVLEGPEESLDQLSQMQRKDILSRWPQYAQLSEQARTIRAKLADMPLVADDQAAWKEQSKALSELSSISMQQEVVLRELSLRREPAEMVFPPYKSLSDIKKALPKGHAILAFFIANRRLYGLLTNNSDYSYWEVSNPVTFMKQMIAALRDMGQYAPNYELTQKDLADTKWNQSSAKTLEALLKNSRGDLSKSFEELIIVPDGMLWFLPFEAMQVSVDGKMQSLISRVKIRYAPTMSLAVTTQPKRIKPTAKTAVVLGKLYPSDNESVSKEAFKQLSESLPGAVALKLPLPGPTSVYKVMFNRLIVLEDMTINDQDPFNWAPVPVEHGKTGGTLGEWMSLPWGGPEEIILPGYHTAAEDALKKSARGVPGDEIFLSVCSMMSCGAKTILLSRWRTGGQSSFDLVREFSQELPHTTPADAWQRAVLLETSTKLNVESEPRLKKAQIDEPPKADHPFFWAGYMLIDSGQVAKINTSIKAPDKPKPAENQKLDAKAPEQPKNPTKAKIDKLDKTKPEKKTKVK